MIEFADTCHHGMVSVAKALLRWKSVGTHRCSDGCPRQVCRQKIRIIITTASSLAGGGRPHAPDRGAAAPFARADCECREAHSLPPCLGHDDAPPGALCDV